MYDTVVQRGGWSCSTVVLQLCVALRWVYPRTHSHSRTERNGRVDTGEEGRQEERGWGRHQGRCAAAEAARAAAAQLELPRRDAAQVDGAL